MSGVLPPPLPRPAPAGVPVRPLTRRGKWLIAGGVFAAVGALAGFVVLVVMFMGYVGGLMKDSEPYRHALATARGDARVRAVLGEPIADGPMPAGRISTGGDHGTATLQIRLEGPRGSAQLHVDATRTDGRWHYTRLELVHDGGRIDLADPP